MKIVIASSFVPFVYGGLRFYVEWLEEKLVEHGHEVERFYLPFVDDPEDILSQTAAFRLIDLSDAGDRLIAVRPPAHVIRHPYKILWFIHHIRMFYDLWDTPLAPAPTVSLDAVRQALVRLDTETIGEAKKVFTNSQAVGQRLMKYNGIASTALYPPLADPEKYVSGDYSDEVVYISRVEPHKRQDLLISAMEHTKTPVRVRICGACEGASYPAALNRQINRLGVGDRVTYDNQWITEEAKIAHYRDALAVVYIPHEEDGIGYPTCEGAQARKAIITASDSGAVLEFVQHERNGFIVEPEPKALAEVLDRLYLDRNLAARYGDAAFARLSEIELDWTHVVRSITG